MLRVFTKNNVNKEFFPTQIEIQTTVSRSNVRGVPEAMTRTALRQVREQNRGRPPIEGQYVHYYDTEESDFPNPSTVNSRTIRHEWPTPAQNSALHICLVNLSTTKLHWLSLMTIDP